MTGMAGWVSSGTIPPVSVYLKSFAWLIRADRTAAPNLQSAVTRGHSRRQSMQVTHCTGQTHIHYMRLHSVACACAACEVRHHPFVSAQEQALHGHQEMMGNGIYFSYNFHYLGDHGLTLGSKDGGIKTQLGLERGKK